MNQSFDRSILPVLYYDFRNYLLFSYKSDTMNQICLSILLSLVFFAGDTPSCAAGNASDKTTVSWNNGNVKLVGDLYLPDSKQAMPFSAIIIIPGSGGLERSDKSFKDYASNLTKKGM